MLLVGFCFVVFCFVFIGTLYQVEDFPVHSQFAKSFYYEWLLKDANGGKLQCETGRKNLKTGVMQ